MAHPTPVDMEQPPGFPWQRRCGVVVVAAGQGRRMGFDKLTAPLAGIPVLLRTLRTFLAPPWLEKAVLVLHPDRVMEVKGWLENEPGRERVEMVRGGVERHDSVRAGLSALPPEVDLVGVHDGARPLLSKQDLLAVYQAAAEHGAATLASPVSDTLKRVDDQGRVVGAVDRRELWGMQTPQVFYRALLERAYQEISASGEVVTDEVSALQAAGLEVRVVAANDFNGKVTYPPDLVVMEGLLQAREQNQSPRHD